MKKTFLLLATGMAMHGMYAQVGIETTDPQATLDVNGDVRIQNSSTIDIPSHKDCPCFLVVDKQGKVKRVPVSQGTGSGSGGSTGGGGTTVIGGVSPSDGGTSSPEVLTPVEEVEMGWLNYKANMWPVTLKVNYPAGIPYSAYTSPEVQLPTLDGTPRNIRLMYPKGTTTNAGTEGGTLRAYLLIDGDHRFPPKLRYTEAEEETVEIPLYFNGVEQNAKVVLRAVVSAVKHTVSGQEYTYPLFKIKGKYLTGLNLEAEYAKEATANPLVLKEWAEKDMRYNEKAYGSLFQWGRPADGHQLVNWTSYNQGSFVNPYSNYSGSYVNPCPTGYHIPKSTEWYDIFNNTGQFSYSLGVDFNFATTEVGRKLKITGDIYAYYNNIYANSTGTWASSGYPGASRNPRLFALAFDGQTPNGFGALEVLKQTDGTFRLHTNNNLFGPYAGTQIVRFPIRCMKEVP